MSSISNGSIGFGGLNTSGGSASLGTTLFGVNIDELVDNLVEARGLANIRRQDKIDANTAKLSAYSSLQGLLNTLKSSASALRNPVVTTGSSDIFDARQVLSTASGTIPAASLFGASTTDNATIGSYQFTINRIAKADTITATATPVDADTTAATVDGGVLILNDVNITIDAGATLNDIRDAINAKKTDSGVSASVVKVTDNQYKLVLKASATGDAITLSDNVGNTLLTELGLAASGATDQSLSAELVLDGTTVYRKTNSVNDLIPGASLELFQADAGHPVTVSVDNNLPAMSEAISTFMDAYNAVVDFVSAQRAVDANGVIGEDQVLFSDSFMSSTYRALQGFLAEGAHGVASGTLKSLRDIGIEIGSDNKLSVNDNNKLEDALINNLDEVKALFGFSASESLGLTVVDRPDSIAADLLGKTVTVRVTATDAQGLPTAASFEVDGNTIAATISNGFIKGAAGTILEGYTVGYDGGVITSTPYEGTFTPTQGIADNFGGLLDAALDPLEGDLKRITDQVSAANTTLNKQITDLNGQLELYRNRLLLQFQAAQQAIAVLEGFQNSIQAQVDSWNAQN